ncbi:hypothetical protein ACN6MT_19345 [Neobacillus niacini]|uniref:hypothetical protein n=1 Tax=Neobacillus niacini TaxID=86668 RepID=UPI003B026913
MKIEIGESLMLSWLKHIKKCQTAQLNWKASTHSWELHNEEKIKKIMNATMKYFMEKHNLNIYKNTTSHLQLLQQGEIDVLGLEVKAGSIANIYGVDVAFHESGLNYGSSIGTIERIIKKMIHTAFLIHGYFNLSKGTIIFASPKIHKAIYEPLSGSIDLLNKIFKVFELDFTFVLYGNQEFRNEIFEPVVNQSKSVADTSELFLRSSQMYNLFSDTKLENTSTTTIEIKPQKTSSITSTEPVKNDINHLKIGALVRNEFDRLIRNNLLSGEMIQHLLDEKYSKLTFDVNYPILRKINTDQTTFDQRMINGYSRYWSTIYKINGQRYFICNDWYEKNRTKFINWVDRLK